MTMANKMAAYTRFYRSVCSHWLCVNITWAAGVSRYADTATLEDTFYNIKYLWCDNIERSLHEKVEATEVADFVWGFLARKIFLVVNSLEDVSQWVDDIEQLDQQIFYGREIMFGHTCFVRLATFYLSPPHIIELLYDMWSLDGKELWEMRANEEDQEEYYLDH